MFPLHFLSLEFLCAARLNHGFMRIVNIIPKNKGHSGIN